MRTIYLSLDEVIAIHDSMIEHYGGSFGIRDIGLIQSAITRPHSSFDGEDLYSTIFDKSAALFHSLLFNHAFVDGNKRKAITATGRFLTLNGYELAASEKDFVVFPLQVENQHLSLKKIANWLKENTKILQ